PVRAASGQRPDRRGGREPARHSSRADDAQRRPLRQHLGRVHPPRVGRGGRGRPAERRRPRAAGRLRRRHDLGERTAAVGRMSYARESEGRVALVTGASRGIGRATALALAQSGHRVAVGWSRDEEGAAKTVVEVEAAGAEALAVRADVGAPAAVDAAFASVESRWAPVEVLVNAAGVTRDGLLLRMGDDQWAEVLRTNLDGTFHCVRRASAGMVRARWGRIVNVGSAAGLLGSAGQVNYATAKAGLVGLTRSVARELASRAVTCNLVTPGPIAAA